jgi:hypothetical protein
MFIETVSNYFALKTLNVKIESLMHHRPLLNVYKN